MMRSEKSVDQILTGHICHGICHIPTAVDTSEYIIDMIQFSHLEDERRHRVRVRVSVEAAIFHPFHHHVLSFLFVRMSFCLFNLYLSGSGQDIVQCLDDACSALCHSFSFSSLSPHLQPCRFFYQPAHVFVHFLHCHRGRTVLNGLPHLCAVTMSDHIQKLDLLFHLIILPLQLKL